MRFDRKDLHLSQPTVILGPEVLIRQHNKAYSATSCLEIKNVEQFKNEQSKHKHIETPARYTFEKTLFGKTIYPRITVREENYLRKGQLPLQSRRTA